MRSSAGVGILLAIAAGLLGPFEPPVLATGPSSATIKVIPVAAGESGAVLFKTYSHINRSGAHSILGAEFGWLCVSASGIWIEGLVLRLTLAEEGAGLGWKLLDQLEDGVDLEDPPQTLIPILEDCGEGPWHELEPRRGSGRVTWLPDGFCIDEKCSEGATPQRSVGGLESVIGAGSPVECSFSYQGVALFRNLTTLEGEDDQGAFFQIENMFQGRDLGIEYLDIDAISIVPKVEPGLAGGRD